MAVAGSLMVTFNERDDIVLQQAAEDALQTFVAATQRAIDADQLPQQDARQLAAMEAGQASGKLVLMT